MVMTSDQIRQVNERLLKAKNELMDAERILEEANNKTLARTVGSLAGRIEHLQHKLKPKLK